MKSLILSLVLLFSLTAQAGKKIVDLNLDSGFFDIFYDRVWVTKELKPLSDNRFIFFKNNNCELLGLSGIYLNSDTVSGRYVLSGKKILKRPSTPWTVILEFHALGSLRRLACKFPAHQFKDSSEITTDHITVATDGIVVF